MRDFRLGMKDKGPGSRVKNEGSVARNELYPSMLNTDRQG